MRLQDYGQRLKRQNAWLWVLLILSVALIIVAGEFGRLDSRVFRQNRVLCGAAENMPKVLFIWQGYMIWRIARNKRLMRDGAAMKEHMVRALDERREAVAGRAGSRFAKVMLIALSVAAAVATAFDAMVFYTLYIVLLAALILWGGMYWWANRSM